ncbi:hypothetical protein VTO42DRAFT_9010 [Malbranchea cinnamomea]
MPTPRNEKLVASGNGITVSISLAEPVLFLEGYERNDRESRKTAMLRGDLRLTLTKPLKIKKVYLNFRGFAVTTWPEGLPGKRNQYHQTHGIMNHTWTFFNAQLPTAEHDYGAHVVQLHGHSSQLSVCGSDIFPGSRNSLKAVSKDMQSLSLQYVRSRSFGKDEFSSGANTIARRGYKWFPPGNYTYKFEMPVDSRFPETVRSEMATIKYELEAMVERSGAFRPNLLGIREIPFVRTPSDDSLEHVEPIAITRNWDDQLHYEIIISGKSFPLGAKIPIAFKLTPLAKVACHRIRVYVTESVQQWSKRKTAHRVDVTKKILLFEKRPDAPFVSAFPGSAVRVTAGGGIDWDRRAAAANGEEIVNSGRTNLLGDLESDFGAGPTEMEIDVQLPTCAMMRERHPSQRLHCDAKSDHVAVNHWIKIVLRLSKQDEAEPQRRRHFEISIDSPFHIMSCLARHANIYLPAYSTPSSIPREGFECGCPDSAQARQLAILPLEESLANPFAESPNPASNRRDTNASSSTLLAAEEQVLRPIHLLRIPSYGPPPFEDVPPPPPLVTPPPDYDSVVPTVDYFERLHRVEYQYDDTRGTARVDIPLTPGGRVNRSMDIPRDWTPVNEAVCQHD